MSALHPPYLSEMTTRSFSKAQPGVLPVFQSHSQTKTFYNRISKFYDLPAYPSEAPVRRIALTDDGCMLLKRYYAGAGGHKMILCKDSSGNVIELFQPARVFA